MSMKITYKSIDSAMNAAKMFELRKHASLSIISGKFKQARTAQKELAKAAVEDFETFKTLPNVRITNVPPKVWFPLLVKSLKFKIYNAFTKKTPEEKLLAKEYKNYVKNLTPEMKKQKTIDITIPSLF